MNERYNKWLLIIICLGLAILGHSYFIYKRVIDGVLMISEYDQFHQMVPFKQYLYHQFTSGSFFYDFNGNAGGNFFTRLSYYYSTSLFYYGTALITFCMEKLGIIKEVTLLYWAENLLFVSIVRQAIIIYVTYLYISYLGVRRNVALFSASLYAISVFYFRQTSSWEFFADAMVWLPIILLGIEKVINKQSGKVFMVGLALTLFNNAYFAYINILLAVFYIGLRWLVKFDKEELAIRKQVVSFIVYGFLATLIALPGLVTFVMGFLETIRPNLLQEGIPFFNYSHSVWVSELLISDIFVIPILFMLLLFQYRIYQNRKVIFAVIAAFVTIVLAFSPWIGSLFNGFSDPQYRWNYGGYLFMALFVGVAFEQLLGLIEQKRVTLKNLVIPMLISVGIYTLVILVFRNSFSQRMLQISIGTIVLTFIVFMLMLKRVNYSSLCFGLLVLIVLHTLTFYPTISERVRNYHYKTTADYQEVLNPSNDLNRALADLEGIKPYQRIELLLNDVQKPSNYLLAKDVNSLYLYSSFQNKQQQTLEDKFDLSSFINRSSGEVVGPNGRSVFNSLLNVDYIIKDKHFDSDYIPATFHKYKTYDGIEIFENSEAFPPFMVTNQFYSQSEVEPLSYKEAFVIDGVISDLTVKQTKLPTINVLNYEMTILNGDYKDEKLTAIKQSEPIKVRIKLVDKASSTQTVNIGYYLRPLGTYNNTYTINGFPRKVVSSDILYSSKKYDTQLQLPLKGSNEIMIELPSDTSYSFKVKHLVGIPNDLLTQEAKRLSQTKYDYEVSPKGIDLTYDNHQFSKYMILPIPMTKGLKVEINGQQVDLFNANYGLVGFPLKAGKNSIHVSYQQPYLLITCIISLVTLLIVILGFDRKIKLDSQNT